MSKSDSQLDQSSACSSLAIKLPGVIDGGVQLSDAERRHVDTCLFCQAELVRYRRLLRALHELRTTFVQPAPGLLADILDHLGERGERRAVQSLITGKRIAYTGGLAVATLAGVTGAVLLAGRAKGKSRGKSAA